MLTGMGNLLETDSDVASISDGERERTDGDGMESETVLDVSNNSSSSTHIDDTAQKNKEPDKTAVDGVVPLSIDDNEILSNSNISSLRKSSVQASTSGLAACASLPTDNQVSSENKTMSSSANLRATVTDKLKTFSPRELPPKSQLIQLKPIMCKPKLSSRNSMESLSEGISKQKNPRFIPYEPYRGAVRPMVAQDEATKKHSRTASGASTVSSGLDQVIGNLSLNASGLLDEAQGCILSENVNENTHVKSLEGRHLSVNMTKQVDAQYLKQEKVIEKQTHALTLVKERLKIAEKDNEDLHKENTRLKKLLVDSLSGDIIQSRVDTSYDQSRISPATSESVDTLSNEIEVWRSKFLSSCVLVEQLTRENGTLNEAISSAANILKEIKLSSSLSPAHYEQVNAWLRANRPTSLTFNDDES